MSNELVCLQGLRIRASGYDLTTNSHQPEKASQRLPTRVVQEKDNWSVYNWVLLAAMFILAGSGVGFVIFGYARSHRSNALSIADVTELYIAATDILDGPPRVNQSEAQKQLCATDVCVWESRNVYGKFNTSVDPCTDFYRHVCSSKWYRDGYRIDERPYRIHTVGQVMYDLEKYFKYYYNLRREKYHSDPSSYTHQVLFFMGNCTKPHRNDTAWHTMKDIFTENLLAGWPYKKEPKGVQLTDVAMVLDKYVGLNSFVKTSWRKTVNDYELRLQAPQLPLRRHQLVFLGHSTANYTENIEMLLSMFTDHDMKNESGDIVVLEKRLLELMEPKTFVPYDQRKLPVKELQLKRTWLWLRYINYLVEDAGLHIHRDTVVIVPDTKYVTRLSLTLSKFPLKTLLNYIGYTLVVKFSPLLTDVDFLMPLSHDNYLETVSPRLQACAHMLEDLCNYLVRRFARLTFGKEDATTMLFHYDNQMKGYLDLARGSMIGTVQQAHWLNQAEVDQAARKLEELQFEFLDARESEEDINLYYPQYVSPFPAENPLLGYYKLLNETRSFYWIVNATYDLDARYDVSSFAVATDYFWERNLLFIPHGVIGFINNISETFHPLFVPLMMPPILRNVFAAVDARGSTVGPRKDATSWWSSLSRSQYRLRTKCFREQYEDALRNTYSGKVDGLLHDIVADNAILHPMYTLYHEAIFNFAPSKKGPRIAGLENFTEDMLFFLNYALGLCDRVHPDLAERQIRYDGSIPSQLRVNIPLMNFPRFAESFNCAENAAMNPKMRCELW